MKKLSPSILDVPKLNLVNYVNQLIEWGITNVHYDIMDGIFVPNKALTLDEVSTIKKECKKHTMDIHCMVEDVFEYYEMYKGIGDILTFHIEALNEKTLQLLFKKAEIDNVKLGLAVSPDSKIELLYPYLDKLKLVLVMSVYPGKGGQKFIESSLEKVKNIRDQIKKQNQNVIIQIDGGVNNLTIQNCFKAGVDLAVVGSYLVKNFSKETIKELLK